MKQNRLNSLRENTLLWLVLLYFTLAGLVLLLGWLISWDKAIQMIEFFLTDQHLAKPKVNIIKQLGFPFMVVHLGLGMLGWILFLSKSRLADLGFVQVEKTEPARFNFFIISSLIALYLFSLYNIPELVTGLRLKVYLGVSYIDSFTAICLFISGVLWSATIFYVRKDDQTQQKLGITGYFLFLALVCFLIAGQKISWGYSLFGWETPDFLAVWNRLYETNLDDLLSRLAIIKWGLAAIFSIILFGAWLGLKESQRDRLEMIIPPIELYIPVALAVSSSGHTNSNFFEELLSLFFLLYSIWIWSKWRASYRSSE